MNRILEEILMEQKHSNNLLRSILAALRANRQFLDIPSMDLNELPYRSASPERGKDAIKD